MLQHLKKLATVFLLATLTSCGMFGSGDEADNADSAVSEVVDVNLYSHIPDSSNIQSFQDEDKLYRGWSSNEEMSETPIINGVSTGKSFYIVFDITANNNTTVDQNISYRITLKDASGFMLVRSWFGSYATSGSDFIISDLNLNVKASGTNSGRFPFCLRADTVSSDLYTNLRFVVERVQNDSEISTSTGNYTFGASVSSKPYDGQQQLRILESDLQLDKESGVFSWVRQEHTDEYLIEDVWSTTNSPTVGPNTTYSVDKAKAGPHLLKIRGRSNDINYLDSNVVEVSSEVLQAPKITTTVNHNDQDSYVVDLTEDVSRATHLKFYLGNRGSNDTPIDYRYIGMKEIGTTKSVDVSDLVNASSIGGGDYKFAATSANSLERLVIDSTQGASIDFRKLQTPSLSLAGSDLTWSTIDYSEQYSLYKNGALLTVFDSRGNEIGVNGTKLNFPNNSTDGRISVSVPFDQATSGDKFTIRARTLSNAIPTFESNLSNEITWNLS